MTAPEAQAQALARAQAQAVATLRARVTAYVTTQWNALGGTYSDQALEQFVSRVVPVVIAGQRQVANVTAAYIAQTVAVMSGQGTVAAAGVPPELVSGAALRGIAPETVYGRPIVTVRTAISAGADVAQALAAGLHRAVNIAGTDMQLARTHAAKLAMKDDERVTGYQRVLTNPRACALCTIASSNKYGRGDLMPIHNQCDCGIAPIIGRSNPGSAMNRAILQTRRADEPGGDADSASGIEVEVRHHGELGPVLTVAGQHFTGPADIPPQAGGPPPQEGSSP